MWDKPRAKFCELKEGKSHQTGSDEATLLGINTNLYTHLPKVFDVKEGLRIVSV